jgi:S-adenosylmethionine:tRNA ribosyltransferase-isomerase
MGMNIKEFDYSLPKASIAQYPEQDREASRMLVLDRADGSIAHKSFRDITQYFKEGDVLVLNKDPCQEDYRGRCRYPAR